MRTTEELLLQRVLTYRRDQDIKHVDRIIFLNHRYDGEFFAPCSVYDVDSGMHYFRVNIMDGAGSNDHSEFTAFGRTLDIAFENVVKKIDLHFENKEKEKENHQRVQERIDELLKK